MPEVLRFAYGLACTHFVFWSLGSSAAGGVMSFHRKSDFPTGATVSSKVLVEGRVIVSFVNYESKVTCFFNIHNYG